MTVQITKGTLIAGSVKLGFVCGIITAAVDSVVFKSSVDESLNYGIAVFAGITTCLVTEFLLSSKGGYIDGRTKTDIECFVSLWN